jgi:hypothetical protein
VSSAAFAAALSTTEAEITVGLITRGIPFGPYLFALPCCTTNGFAFRARGLGGFRHLISPTGLAFEECEELLNIIKNTV